MSVIVLITGAFIAALPNATAAQSAAESKLELVRLLEWLPGDYDNEPQVFTSTGMGAKPEDLPPRRHLVIEQVDDSPLGEHVYRWLEHAGDEHSPVARTRHLVLEHKPETTRITLRVLDEEGGDVLLRQTFADGKPPEGDVTCAAELRPLLDTFVASTRCLDSQGKEVGGRDSDWALGPDQLWFAEAYPEGDSGRVLVDPVPTRFYKTREFECFAAVQKRDGEPDSHIPLYLHDRGGTVHFQTREPDPQNITLQLRRALWPSRSGNNFVELLLIYLYDDAKPPNLIANGWTTPEAGRVGFGSTDEARKTQRAGARCKLKP